MIDDAGTSWVRNSSVSYAVYYPEYRNQKMWHETRNTLALSCPITSQRVTPVQRVCQMLQRPARYKCCSRGRENRSKTSLEAPYWDSHKNRFIPSERNHKVLLPVAHTETQKSISNESLGTRDLDSP